MGDFLSVSLLSKKWSKSLETKLRAKSHHHHHHHFESSQASHHLTKFDSDLPTRITDSFSKSMFFSNSMVISSKDSDVESACSSDNSFFIPADTIWGMMTSNRGVITWVDDSWWRVFTRFGCLRRALNDLQKQIILKMSMKFSSYYFRVKEKNNK